MEGKDYWGYWINVVQKLRVEVNELKKRVEKLEKGTTTRTQPARQPRSMKELAGGGKKPQTGGNLNEKEVSACIALKEIGKPATVTEINEHLRKHKEVKETVKETLFTRLKGAMEKGYVGFDQESKKFQLIREDFQVS